MRRFFQGTILVALTTVSMATTTFAADPSLIFDCRLEFASQDTKVEICTASDERALVKIVWQQKKDTPPTLIKAMFSADSEKLWQSLAIPSGDPKIQRDAQDKLRRELYEYGPQHLNSRTHAVLDFIVNFAQPETSLKGFDPKFTEQLQALQTLGSWYNLICDAFGKTREATVNVKDTEFRKTYTVGDSNSLCPGRCGAGCAQFYEWRVNQYTQECLNHDACTDLKGVVLGECQVLFVQAALGYLLAPNCADRPSNQAHWR